MFWARITYRLFERDILLRVLAALRAAARRFGDPLRFAARLACAETALDEAVPVLSRRSAFIEALARLRVLSACFPGCLTTVCTPAPGLFGFGGTLTPAFLAFDSPIAIACCTDRAPCLPVRT